MCWRTFGEHDFFPADDQQSLGERIGAGIARFEDVGHDPHYKYPQRVANAILEFVYRGRRELIQACFGEGEGKRDL